MYHNHQACTHVKNTRTHADKGNDSGDTHQQANDSRLYIYVYMRTIYAAILTAELFSSEWEDNVYTVFALLFMIMLLSVCVYVCL